jgi:Fe-S cluster biosynthesis and repair protein YggX
MSTTVFCKKFQKDLPAMTVPPMPGPKGREIMENCVSRGMGILEITSNHSY